MLNPDKSLKLSLPLVAFADNTNLLGNENSQQQPIDELIKEAQDCLCGRLTQPTVSTECYVV
jgi:hypothetical protein